MKNKILIGVIIFAIIVGIVLLLVPRKKDNGAATTDNSSTAQTTSATSSSSSTTANKVDATIKFTDSGFAPASITVKSGQTVAFENSSSQLLQVNSDPHPEHTDNQELNIGTITAGTTQTAVLKVKGEWGYHNHLNPSEQGTIIVE